MHHCSQAAAFEEVTRGGDVMLASHTGSGKTLAYLLPLVGQLHGFRLTHQLWHTNPPCAWLNMPVRSRRQSRPTPQGSVVNQQIVTKTSFRSRPYDSGRGCTLRR